jgi:pimeloyl-ACP methyl ester carboxylesterase
MPIGHRVVPDRHFRPARAVATIVAMTRQRGTTQSPTTSRSRDGTGIAYSTTGDGPPLVLVDGALCHRGVGPNRKLAGRLADDFTVVTYDRRGRGESGDTTPSAVEREVEDIAAIVADVGGQARLYGISSGGALALEAARLLPDVVEAVAVYEIPYVVDDSRPPAPVDLADSIEQLITAGRPGDAVKLFMREAVLLPSFLVAAMPLFPGWSSNKALAKTLPYDLAVMGDGQRGNPVPRDRWSSITVPTLVASGGKSPGWVQAAAAQLADVVPGAQLRSLPGQRHYVKPDAIAPILTGFFTGSSAPASRPLSTTTHGG